MSSEQGPQRRLESLLSEAGNGFCADCGSPDPKWVSSSFGAFICIKCSGIHRSLGVHISKVLSVKLDEWTDDQVDELINMGGNTIVNSKYEAHIPDDYHKPKPEASIEERTDFIRRKYVLQQFLNSDLQQGSYHSPSLSSSSGGDSPSHFNQSAPEKQNRERHRISSRIHSLGHAFRNSWRRSEHKPTKKDNLMAGMVEFVGFINVNIIRGTNLAVRDMLSSDPYVIVSLGNQTMKTRVIKKNLNPVWNENLMLSIPDHIPPLKLIVYDKDTFSADDFMGDAEIDIQPLVNSAKASEEVAVADQLENGDESEENMPLKDGVITMEDGRVKQKITVKLQNVERGELEIELECVLLSQ